ncbi:sodium:solute symporter family transporter [Photobacterium iliopiscarium]|uniref:sodium:solute symporter family transporter n=1 Tax=Photobacterium iliopiscarium TaxID=56192 RepID=UPI000A9ED144|nr:hypothetical protein [Photobacterium iliopiscarium]
MNTSLNWGLLFVTVTIMVGLALYSNKVMHSSKGEGGFLLAANCLGPFIGASTIVATAFSGWGFMGSPGVPYKYGVIELLGNFFFAPAMILAVLFCARFLHQKAQTMGTLTIAEYIAVSHDGPQSVKRITQAFCAIITIVLLLIFLVGQIKALGLSAKQPPRLLWSRLLFSTPLLEGLPPSRLRIPLWCSVCAYPPLLLW